MYCVDSGNYISDNCSLALDSNGYAHMIYTKVSSIREFKHATNKN
jgi:hypothetical protein